MKLKTLIKTDGDASLYQEEIKVSFGQERYKVSILALATENGISVTLTGGDQPHVGGVSLCVPRPSIADPEGESCDTWVCPVPGHKDNVAGAAVADFICRQTGRITAVVAGIHIDQATGEEIDLLFNNCMEAARELIRQIKGES